MLDMLLKTTKMIGAAVRIGTVLGTSRNPNYFEVNVN